MSKSKSPTKDYNIANHQIQMSPSKMQEQRQGSNIKNDTIYQFNIVDIFHEQVLFDNVTLLILDQATLSNILSKEKRNSIIPESRTQWKYKNLKRKMLKANEAKSYMQRLRINIECQIIKGNSTQLKFKSNFKKRTSNKKTKHRLKRKHSKYLLIRKFKIQRIKLTKQFLKRKNNYFREQIEFDNENYEFLFKRIRQEEYITKERVNQLKQANENIQNRIQHLKDVYLSLTQSESGVQYKKHLMEVNKSQANEIHTLKRKQKEDYANMIKNQVQQEQKFIDQKIMEREQLKNSIQKLSDRYQLLQQKQRIISEFKIVQMIQVSKLHQEWQKFYQFFSTENTDIIIIKYQQLMLQYQSLEFQLKDKNEQILNLQNVYNELRKQRDQVHADLQTQEQKKYQLLASTIKEPIINNPQGQQKNIVALKYKNLQIEQKIRQTKQIAIATLQLFYLNQSIENKDTYGILGPKIHYEFIN